MFFYELFKSGCLREVQRWASIFVTLLDSQKRLSAGEAHEAQLYYLSHLPRRYQNTIVSENFMFTLIIGADIGDFVILGDSLSFGNLDEYPGRNIASFCYIDKEIIVGCISYPIFGDISF